MNYDTASPETSEYGTRKRAASCLGVSVAAIIKWEREGYIPSPVRLGKCVRHHLPTLLTWAAAQRRQG